MWHYRICPPCSTDISAILAAAAEISVECGEQMDTSVKPLLRYRNFWTDERTPDKCIDPALHTMQAVPKNHNTQNKVAPLRYYKQFTKHTCGKVLRN